MPAKSVINLIWIPSCFKPLENHTGLYYNIRQSYMNASFSQTKLACQVVIRQHLLTEVMIMEDFSKFKKAHYKQNVCVAMEGGAVLFSPDSLKEVVGAEKMTYDEYLDVQLNSLGKIRGYFETCYFNHPMGFMGQVEKITKDTVCFKRIFVSGMFSDGTMFDGKEDHVWLSKNGFEDLKTGDCVSFFAEVYRYVKTGNGKQLDYSLRNPESIKRIESYELPSDRELMLQDIDMIICESCFLYDNCNRVNCMMNPKQRKQMRQQMLAVLESKPKEER